MANLISNFIYLDGHLIDDPLFLCSSVPDFTNLGLDPDFQEYVVPNSSFNF